MSDRFHTLTIADIRRETADAISVRFDVPDALRGQFAFKAGQHLTLRTRMEGQEIRRNYSLCVSPLEGELRVTIKRIHGGAFSNWANDTLAAGQKIEVMQPHGSFVWPFAANAVNRYVGFAGGSGITPVMSLLKTALRSEPLSRFTLLYGNRDSSSIIFLEELAALKNAFLDRLEVFHFLSDEEDEIELFNGMLDREKCDLLLSELIDPAQVSAFFICGPGPMMDAAEAALAAKGVDPARIHIERFTAGAVTAAQAQSAARLEKQAAGLKVTVSLDGRRHNIEFDAALGNILDSARASGLPAPFACKGGVCATCRAKVVSGEVEMKRNFGLTPEEVAQGYVLTCQAVPLGEGVVIDYEA